MAISDSLKDYLATLREVIADLGLDGQKLQDKETVDDVQYDQEIPAGNLKGIDPDPKKGIDQEKLDRWFRTFGKALELASSLEGYQEDSRDETPHPTWGANEQRHDADELRLHREFCEQFEDATVKFVVRINKQLLVEGLRKLIKDDGRTLIELFFFERKLQDVLKADYPEFEKNFLGVRPNAVPPDRRLLILIADSKGRVQGPYLGLLGSDHCDDFAGFFEAAESRPLDRLRQARDTLQNTPWDDRPRLLTPDFFVLTGPDEAADLGACRGELIRLQNRLAAAFLANRSRRENKDAPLHSTFEGSRTVTMALDDERGSSDLYSLFNWAYDHPDAAATRLEIVRRVVASRLPTNKEEGFQVLVRTSRDLLSECEVQLQLLVDKNIAESFKHRQEAEQAVRQYVDGVGERIEALVKEVIDNAYKTVGLLVGIVIAYLLEPTRSPVVLVLGTVGYIAYILFVRFFYLTSYNEDFLARKAAFQDRRGEIEADKILKPSVLALLDKEIKEKEKQFCRKYKTVSCLYFTFAGIALIFLAGWWGYRSYQSRTPDPESIRQQALERQAERLKKLKYNDVRIDLESWKTPDQITDSSHQTFTPELTAIRPGPAATLVVMELITCSETGKAETLQRLKQLARIDSEHRASIQLLTEEVCNGRPGPEQLREWMAANQLPLWSIWSS